jgi:hypothetical protein
MMFMFRRYILLVIVLILMYASNAEVDDDDEVMLRKTAQETYNRVIPCLKHRTHPIPAGFDFDNVKFPLDAKEHYQDLLSKTLKYRTAILPHKYKGYDDNWIENHFIETFSKRPLKDFGGLIPIFIQWTDIHVHYINSLQKKQTNNNNVDININITKLAMPKLPSNTFDTIYDTLFSMLRPTVLYVVLTQDDQGLFKLSKLAPNILSISAGGYGNIPIPLIKGNIQYKPNILTTDNAIEQRSHHNVDITKTWGHYVGFYGNVRPGLSRSKLLKSFSDSLRRVGLQLFLYSGKDWIQQIESTMFNLAPRGFGRTSFRLAEIIQIGRIPVYMYDDIPWLPYSGTNISISQFGYVAGKHNYEEIAKTIQIHSRDITEIKKRLLEVKRIREHYTYEGVIAQLEMFFKCPLGENESGGQLKCHELPTKPH